MEALIYTSEDFVKSNIYFSKDGSTARLFSSDVCEGIADETTKYVVFDEAVEFVTRFLTEYVPGVYKESFAGYSSMTWNKK